MSRPWILGPDDTGRTIVVAGDRIAWAGTEPTPKMPGAGTFAVPGTTLLPGRIARLDDAECLRGDPAALADRFESLLRAQGVTTIVACLASTGGEPALDRASDAVFRALAKVPLRALLGIPLPRPRRGEDPVLAALLGLPAVLRSPLVRPFLFVEDDLAKDEQQELTIAAEALGHELVFARDLARDAVTPPAVGRRFGRRVGSFEPGAVGDVIAEAAEGVRHATVGGRLLLRDGVLVESRP